MILDFLIDLLCVLFLLVTSVFCLTWVRLRDRLPWKGRRSVALGVKTLAVFVGVWHLLFGLLKLVYLILWTVTT